MSDASPVAGLPPARVVQVPRMGHRFIDLTGTAPAAQQAMVQLTRDWSALLDQLPA